MANYLRPQKPLQDKEGNYIYPLTTAEQVELSCGRRLNAEMISVNLSAANEGEYSSPINADTLGGYSAEEYVRQALPLGVEFGGTGATNAKDAKKNLGVRAVARNLLDNSDFTNPVNQRGVTNADTVGYCIDRWMLAHSGKGGYNVDERGAFLYNYENGHYADFIQIIDRHERFTGKVMTFAVKYVHNDPYNEDILILNFTFGEYKVQEFVEGIQLIHFNGDRVHIRHTQTDWSGAFKWAALYEGEYTAETLPEYQPKGYAAELAECRRYYRHFNPYEGAWIGSIASGIAYISIDLSDSPMRVAPSIASGGCLYMCWNGGEGASTSVVTIHKSRKSLITLKCYTSAAVYGNCSCSNYDIPLGLSADL